MGEGVPLPTAGGARGEASFLFCDLEMTYFGEQFFFIVSSLSGFSSKAIWIKDKYKIFRF